MKRAGVAAVVVVPLANQAAPTVAVFSNLWYGSGAIGDPRIADGAPVAAIRQGGWLVHRAASLAWQLGQREVDASSGTVFAAVSLSGRRATPRVIGRIAT
jgi:hypothetical protein